MIDSFEVVKIDFTLGGRGAMAMALSLSTTRPTRHCFLAFRAYRPSSFNAKPVHRPSIPHMIKKLNVGQASPVQVPPIHNSVYLSTGFNWSKDHLIRDFWLSFRFLQVLENQAPCFKLADWFALLEALGKQNSWTLTLEVSNDYSSFYSVIVLFAIQMAECVCIFRCFGGCKGRNGTSPTTDSIRSSSSSWGRQSSCGWLSGSSVKRNGMVIDLTLPCTMHSSLLTFTVGIRNEGCRKLCNFWKTWSKGEGMCMMEFSPWACRGGISEYKS